MDIKVKIRSILAERLPGVDVAVWAFGIPYGYWIWDENELTHDHLKAKDIDQEIRDGLPVVHLTKQDVYGSK